eukprot:m.97417 g.97417  ORF g.97417 m.97417 type:complete len:126 (+) comp12495_c1_seq8:211-588(+)
MQTQQQSPGHHHLQHHGKLSKGSTTFKFMSTQEVDVYSCDLFNWARDAYGIEFDFSDDMADLRDGIKLCALASKVERAHTIAALECGDKWRPMRIKCNNKAQPGRPPTAPISHKQLSISFNLFIY